MKSVALLVCHAFFTELCPRCLELIVLFFEKCVFSSWQSQSELCFAHLAYRKRLLSRCHDLKNTNLTILIMMNRHSVLCITLRKCPLLIPAIAGWLSLCVPAQATSITTPAAVQVDTLNNLKVDHPATYKGGSAALLAEVSRNLKYTKKMIDDGVQGKVFVKFVVNEKGKVTDVAVAKSLSAEADAEAVRVVRLLGRFKPARHQGQKVPVIFYLPIGFSIR